jgi:hypothetical protein
MFENDLIMTRDYPTKTEKIAAFHTFLDSIHQRKDKFPFTIENEEKYKGKPIVFTVTSFGGYFNANNQWTVFIAYRSNNPKHTIQHCWAWDGDKQEPFNYRVMEFIN